MSIKKLKKEDALSGSLSKYAKNVKGKIPSEDPIRAACGILPSHPSLAERLLKERKGEFK